MTFRPNWALAGHACWAIALCLCGLVENLVGQDGATGSAAGQQRMQQRLGEVSALLDQVNAITGGAMRQQAGASLPAGRQNPFQTLSQPNQDTPLTTGQTNVEIDPQSITVQVNGRQFSVPRVNGSPAVSFNDQLGSVAPWQLRQDPFAGNANAALQLAGAYQNFSDALEAFRTGDIQTTTGKLEQAMPMLSSNPVVMQFASIVQFEAADYRAASATVYESLQQSNGMMSWQSILAMYGQDADRYATSYKKLQQVAVDNPQDPSIQFLVGCHHLMLGHQQHALRAFDAAAQGLSAQGLNSADPVIEQLRQAASKNSTAPPPPVDR